MVEEILKIKIEREARRRLEKWRKDAADKKKRFERFQKKSNTAGPFQPLGQPSLWSQFTHFNPYYCIKNSKYIARVIVTKVRQGTYRTQMAVRHKLPKPDGSFREVDAFGIPDAALCTHLSECLRTRNDNIFSAYSYAYRASLKPVDAINRLSNFLRHEKVYVSKYDFKNYFGSVSHDFIERNVINSDKFKITNFEKTVIRALLVHEYTEKGGASGRREKGFPPGNSLSLFLANAVGDYLDAALDKHSGNYIRYADDSLVVSYSYEDAIKLISSYSEFSRETKVKINKEKSTGISIISDRSNEMRTSREVSFLGYDVSKNDVTLSSSAMKRLKSRCSKIIYRNLLMMPKRTGCIPSRRVSSRGEDWDLLSCIYELRLMLYGGVKSRRVTGYLRGRYRLKSMSGAISYYCLVRKASPFVELDGWLIWALQRALAARYKYSLCSASSVKLRVPTSSELVSGSWLMRLPADSGAVPSFVTAWRASRKAWFSYGNLGAIGRLDVYGDE